MFKKTSCLLITLLLVIPAVLFSQSEGKGHIDNWWSSSARLDSTDNFKFFARARYSYAKMKGVVSGELQSGDVFLAVRKGNFTNYSAYKIDQMDLSLESIVSLSYASTKHTLTDFITYDISKAFFAESGFIWERDEAMLLKNRYNLYAGLGVSTVLVKKLKLSTLVALGWIDQDYTIAIDDFDLIKKAHAAYHIKLNFNYMITPYLLFAGQGDYFNNINESDRHRFSVDFNLSVFLVKHLSLVVGYNHRYDKDNERLGLIPDNSTFKIGIEVSI